MKKSSLVIVLLLSMLWIPSLSQPTQTPLLSPSANPTRDLTTLLPAWREQAIVIDLIKLKQCDSLSREYLFQIFDLKALAQEQGMTIVNLKAELTEFKMVMVPALQAGTQALQEKITTLNKVITKLKRQIRLVVAGAVVVVVLITHPWN